MLIHTNAIVLSKLKFSDNDLIVKCYTEQKGVVSYFLRGILKSKKGKNKLPYFQLLSQLNLVTKHSNNRSLQTIQESKLGFHYSSLHSNIQKSAIVMFLAEVLSNSLKEDEHNELLYTYLETTLQWLDTHDNFSNFHLLFLLNLTKHLGFYPDKKNISYNYFSLLEGKFLNTPNKFTIESENLALLKQMLGTTFEDLSSIKISAKNRQEFLNMILLFFELHLGSFKKPKSLDILHQVFN